MILEIISIGLILGNFAYHRWFEEKEEPQPDPFDLPKVEEGEPPSIVFGKCLVRSPVLAWVGEQRARVNPGGVDGDTYWQGAPFLYDWEALYLIGIPFHGGTSKVHSIYAGDIRVPDGDDADPFATPGTYTPLSGLTGNGSFEGDTRPCLVWAHHSDAASNGSAYEIGGLVEFLNGNDSQTIVNDSSVSTTATGRRMLDRGLSASQIPGFRGYLSMFLGSKDIESDPSDPPGRWGIGNTPRGPAYSFEVSTYPASDYFSGYFGPFTVGEEANPAHVIAAILCDRFGKLGMSTDVLHGPSFAKAAQTLLSEAHGYSRCFDKRTPAREMIDEILRQIDAVLWRDEDTGLFKIKLIRADYDPATLPLLHPANCRVDPSSFDAGSWIDVPNAVRVNFENRSNGYRDDSATAQTMANAVGQSGELIEVALNFPGVKTSALAEVIAARELAWRSKPLMKCSVFASRTFIDAAPGDVLRLTYSDLNISERMMRVAAVSYGVNSDNFVKLDLVEDAFYVFRRRVHPGGGVAPHPTPGPLDPG